MSIADAIRQLTATHELAPELYDVVLHIARSSQKNSESNDNIEPEDLAGDFIVALAKEEISGLIVTKSDLEREFNRWLTRRDSPQRSELWLTISGALRALEKAGRACRPENQRAFHNSNETRWFLPQNKGKTADLKAKISLSKRLKSSRKKNEKSKLLSPSVAKSLVLEVLEAASGEISMKTIFDLIAEGLPMFSVQSLDGSGIVDDGETDRGDMHERIAAEAIPADNHFFIEEEATDAAQKIWHELGRLSRGKRGHIVKGEEILCCYILPKEGWDAKVTLSKFGPTSTVQDLVNDIRRLLCKWCSFEPIAQPAQHSIDVNLCSEIRKEIIRRLMEICSENGYCINFKYN